MSFDGASDPEITQMLHCLQTEDHQSEEALYAAVYHELRRIARNLKTKERQEHTLCTCSLVHEAYMHLSVQQQTQWKNRSHFFAVASMTMRRVLINYARDRVAAKRGGGMIPEPLDESTCIAPGLNLEQLLEVDQLLTEMEQFDPAMVRVIECRYFTGLTIEESADALGISPSTVKRQWQLGRAWIKHKAEG
ncbi:RNA polymerase sigma-24 factor ECF subfamily [Thiolapillus brandeum]|uniref:RNA polymerase sigma-24 factor ECF subfamily n=2 Tax=Thiolapillus brandeum TaxID=1076588 RepID=A0A7U6GI54_9GAMM|nr:RNA polymerase sigma-24 factor ECF subfamily [Thiolapillus brandeum]